MTSPRNLFGGDGLSGLFPKATRKPGPIAILLAAACPGAFIVGWQQGEQSTFQDAARRGYAVVHTDESGEDSWTWLEPRDEKPVAQPLELPRPLEPVNRVR